MKPQRHHPTSVHSTKGVGYSHAATTDNLVFLAGQIALDKDGNLVGKDDIEAQTRQVYANLSAVLVEMGSSMEDVVKLTTYMTRRADLDGFRKVRNELFADPFPPNTLVFISGLASPDYLIEIEAIAVRCR